MKREYVMLAHGYDPKKYHIGGWFVSEKLDGERCIWDGGITRGVSKKNVPWANTAKDSRYVDAPIATGLWTRYGNVIQAPNFWLDQLPKIPLDGELYFGRNQRQSLMTIIKKLVPGQDWEFVSYNVFDLVPFEMWLADGTINNTNFKKTLKGISPDTSSLAYVPKGMTQFVTTVDLMKQKIQENKVIKILHQHKLPDAADEAEAQVKTLLEEISLEGGEGLIIKSPAARWTPERSHMMQKVKKLDDMEGTVIGYTSGRETDKGSKLLGKMGALILDIGGKRLELSGFTDGERELDSDAAKAWACIHTGQELPPQYSCRQFPRGTVVTFKYRGLSEDGIPQEARFWRRRS